jgi:hypothetical protein
MPFIAHSKAISAGAAPKETISESESYSAPKRALGPRHARHPAIESVEHHGDENRHGRMFEAPGHRLDYGVETGKQRGRRQQVGQHIDAAPTQFGIHQRLARWNGGMVGPTPCLTAQYSVSHTQLQLRHKNKKGANHVAPPCQMLASNQFLVWSTSLFFLIQGIIARNCSPTCSIGCCGQATARRHRRIVGAPFEDEFLGVLASECPSRPASWRHGLRHRSPWGR